MDFVNRLKFFMENGGITISQFADTCRIPRPTMSQILNGRNKKVSDELIAKIHAAYPELSVLWLMFGEGSMTTQPNMQISEAKNSENSEIGTRQQLAEQTIDNTAAPSDGLFENLRENSHQAKTLFDTEINTPHSTSHDNKSENIDTVNERRQYYVRTHELIEFDTDTPAQPTDATEAPSPEITEHPDATDRQQQLSDNAPANTATPEGSKRNISLSTAADKRITNIVVFYSDNSFQSFYPTVF